MACTVDKRNDDEHSSVSVFSGEEIQYHSIFLQLYFIYISRMYISLYSRAVDDGKSTKRNVSWLGGQCGDWTRRRDGRTVSCRRNGWIVVECQTKLFAHKRHEFTSAGWVQVDIPFPWYGMVWYDRCSDVSVGHAKSVTRKHICIR